MLVDKNGNVYYILYRHPNGDYFVRYGKSYQSKWVANGNGFYKKKYIEGE